MNTNPFLLYALLFLSIASSHAQVVTGNLEGRALDPQGSPLLSSNFSAEEFRPFVGVGLMLDQIGAPSSSFVNY